MFDVCLIGSGGHWENQWSFVLSHFKPRKVYLIGDMSERLRLDVTKIETAEEIEGHLVVLAPSNGYEIIGEVALPDYEHPENCTYLFGSDHEHLTSKFMGERLADTSVYIPTETHDNMYSFVAGAITLYDRYIKYGESDNGQ